MAKITAGRTFERPDGGVGTYPQKGGMTKTEVTGEAKQNVIADGEDAEDGKLLQQVRVGRPDGGEP